MSAISWHTGAVSTSGSRLLSLLVFLGSRPWSTAAELAERLGVTPRTIRRDVESLRGLGYPVESLGGPGGGYGLGAGGRLPPLLLDDEEAMALAVGLRLVGAASVSGVADAASRAALKLDQVLPAASRSKVDALAEATLSLDRGREPVDPTVLMVLADAIDARRRVRMSYRTHAGDESERIVSPYRVVHARGRWYLVAHDHDRDDWRTFRVDRIGSALVTTGAARWPDPPDAVEYVSRSVSTAPYRWTVRVLVDAARPEVVDRVPPTVGVVEAAGSRSLLTTGTDDLDLAVVHLMALGYPFQVLEPPELGTRLRAAADRLLRAVAAPDRT